MVAEPDIGSDGWGICENDWIWIKGDRDRRLRKSQNVFEMVKV